MRPNFNDLCYSTSVITCAWALPVDCFDLIDTGTLPLGNACVHRAVVGVVSSSLAMFAVRFGKSGICRVQYRRLRGRIQVYHQIAVLCRQATFLAMCSGSSLQRLSITLCALVV
jgi:hypothetical protein